MSDSIVYVDLAEVRQGRLEELKRAMAELAAFVEANEPAIVAYNVYFSDDGTRLSVTHIHRDHSSLEQHMRVAGPRFSAFAEFVRLSTIDVYGVPTDWSLAELRKKAQQLGGATVRIHRHHAGFARLDSG